MRLVHLSDLHLGFRQYQRLTPGGINQREADVAATATRAIDQIIAVAPQLIVVGGDIFHSVRPSNPAIVHAFRAFSRLQEALPATPIVMVAGNHDAPRTTDTGCILKLFREVGIHVADTRSELFTFPSLSLAVLAVPDVPGIDRPPMLPAEGFAHNVLLLHGEVEGAMPAAAAAMDRAAIEIPIKELNTERWSYVALGHYHVHREVAPHSYYSGSIDYTSTNPWGELQEERERGLPGKGFIEYDLSTGTHQFHAVRSERQLLDLEPIDASGMGAGEVNAAVQARVATARGGIDDRVVRLLVRNIARHVARELDHAAMRDYRRRAMHFHLDTRRPEPLARHGAGGGAPGRRASLADMVTERLRERSLQPGIDRDALLALGLEYLKQAEEAVSAAMPMVDG